MDSLKIRLDRDSLTTLLRSNLSCHLSKRINLELLDELTEQIVESIEFFLNCEEG
jgi:hypothetical protein